MPNRFSLSEIASRFHLSLDGDDAEIEGVGTLSGAEPTEISFLSNPGYRGELGATRAAAVILKPADVAACPTRSLVTDEPYLAFARVAALFEPDRSVPAGIHPSAVVDPTARLGAGVRIGPLAVVGARCEIGDGCTIGPGTVIEPGSCLGRDCSLAANVSIGHAVRIGSRVRIHAGVVIGADGFGIALAGDHWEKVPQLGSVVIGDDCEIGANTTIDRGAIRDTVIGEGTKIDNLVQVGHNTQIGRHCIVVARTGISGSVTLGDFVVLAAGAGVKDHVTIGEGAQIAAVSNVYNDVPAGARWGGIRAKPVGEWMREIASLERLARARRGGGRDGEE